MIAQAIGEAVVSGIRALRELARGEDEAQAAEAKRVLEELRARAEGLPNLEADGEWDRDLAERLGRG